MKDSVNGCEKMNKKDKLQFLEALEENNPMLFKALVNNWRIGLAQDVKRKKKNG